METEMVNNGTEIIFRDIIHRNNILNQHTEEAHRMPWKTDLEWSGLRCILVRLPVSNDKEQNAQDL